MKRISSAIFALILLLSSFSFAGSLDNVRFATHENKLRVVLDLTGEVKYSLDEKGNGLVITLSETEATENIPGVVEINDWAVPHARINREGNDLKVEFPLDNPIGYNVFSLSGPSRLVIDFGKSFTKVSDSQQVSDGLEYYSVAKRGDSGLVKVQVLKVDPKKVDIFPSLAEPEAGIWDWMAGFFKGPVKKDKTFTRETVKDIVRQKGAVAGVNATYFAGNGRPLGVLVVDGEIVSCPIHDRTAMILTDKNRALIDNISFMGYFKKGEKKFDITKINEPRSSRSEVVLYTRRYGGLTGTDRSGYELAVEKSKVVDTATGSLLIPEEGYVLSAGQGLAEILPDQIKKDDKIETVLHLLPYSLDLKEQENVLHVVGGGPRLLKSGKIYISKYEEKFKKDIAQGRAARTAAGITKDGEILFVTVDGLPRNKNQRSESSSIGMTLTELAYFMGSIGAVDAINFDGGGSSTMILNDRVQNVPA
ncbi:MAG: phosphodiester glycosidase family protein, partial [Candidatus Margulisbacteria bacterium]|nr:phosphodiester glycosidase family protein [Candidatus Margulisiibacteriota bacterium]